MTNGRQSEHHLVKYSVDAITRIHDQVPSCCVFNLTFSTSTLLRFYSSMQSKVTRTWQSHERSTCKQHTYACTHIDTHTTRDARNAYERAFLEGFKRPSMKVALPRTGRASAFTSQANERRNFPCTGDKHDDDFGFLFGLMRGALCGQSRSEVCVY